jgi:hypothetical protein
MNRFVVIMCCVCWTLIGVGSESIAQINFCNPVPQATCSFTSINGNCQVNVDRANAISPPTIYMKPGSNLTVVVYNATPLETLTLDLSSYTSALRPDVFQTIFNSVTPNASKAIASRRNPVVDKNAPPLAAPGTSIRDVETQAETVIYEQNNVIDEVDASLVLGEVAVAARGMTSQSCSLSPETTTDQFPNPWFQTDDWKTVIKTRLSSASSGTGMMKDQLQQAANVVAPKMTPVATLIAAWNLYSNPNNAGHGTLSAEDQRRLDHANQILKVFGAQQGALNAKITARNTDGTQFNAKARLNDLSSTIDLIPKQDPPRGPGDSNMTATFVIKNPKGVKAFNVSGSWALNFTNVLTGIVAQVSQTNYVALNAQISTSYTQLSAPTKTQAMSLTVQSTNKEWVEASAGFVVPWRAYRSYSAAAQASAGSVTGNVVQLKLTHTVVPAAFVNVNLIEVPSRHGSFAVFLSPFVGYNGTTSTVETGIGPTISWKSLAINLMADYASDTYLSGGFSVGQSLGASNPASPLTTNAYSWRFAPGISIRIPLGSSGGNSGGGATGNSGATSTSGGTAVSPKSGKPH